MQPKRQAFACLFSCEYGNIISTEEHPQRDEDELDQQGGVLGKSSSTCKNRDPDSNFPLHLFHKDLPYYIFMKRRY